MVLPSKLRLRGYKCFDHLYKQGVRYYGSSMTLRVVGSKPNLLKTNCKKINRSDLKCAVSISNKVSKKAVTRNKLRRLLHNHLKERLNNKNYKYWALISLKPTSTIKSSDILLKECDKLLSKAGLLK